MLHSGDFNFVFIMSVVVPHTRISGIKQDLLEFQNKINSLLVDIKTEMQSQFDDINNMLNMIENNIRSSNNDQVKEVCQILKTIINALKDDNKKLHSKAEGLEMKLCENELSLNRLDQYNCRNNIEIKVFP